MVAFASRTEPKGRRPSSVALPGPHSHSLRGLPNQRISAAFRQIEKTSLVPGGIRTIDAHGLLVLPGGVDVHTLPLMPALGMTPDDSARGTKATGGGAQP